MSGQFILNSNQEEAQRDLDGITMKNFNVHSKYRLKPRHTVLNGTTMENLGTVLSEHASVLRNGIELVAKTYGIRNVVQNDGQIFTAALMFLSIPFMILIIALCVEGKYSKKSLTPK